MKLLAWIQRDDYLVVISLDHESIITLSVTDGSMASTRPFLCSTNETMIL